MVQLPSIDELVRRTQALATLDLIMSPEWEYRYYSFNAKWSPQERMASMRNGCGDEWWIVFHNDGWAALKGVDHESEAWSDGGQELSQALQGLIPTNCGDFTSEAAFCWDTTGFAYFYMPMGGWARANDLSRYSTLDAGDVELLKLLVAGAGDYVQFAEEYFERVVPESVVEAIYMHQPITERIVQSLNPDASLRAIEKELYEEIDYPK
jgi:hypothetical protein